MQPDPFHARILAALEGAAFRGVARAGSLFSTGITYSSGRQLALSFEPTLVGIRVSDAGGAWTDLFMDGLADACPSVAQLRHLEAACARRSVSWDRARQEVVGHVRQDASTETHMRALALEVALTSLTIEGARSWMAPRIDAGAEKAEIMRRIEQIAERSRFGLDRSPAQGKRIDWDVDLRLHQGGKFVGCRVVPGKALRLALQLATGLLADVPTARGMVLVVGDDDVRAPEFFDATRNQPITVVSRGPHVARATVKAALDFAA